MARGRRGLFGDFGSKSRLFKLAIIVRSPFTLARGIAVNQVQLNDSLPKRDIPELTGFGVRRLKVESSFGRDLPTSQNVISGVIRIGSLQPRHHQRYKRSNPEPRADFTTALPIYISTSLSFLNLAS